MTQVDVRHFNARACVVSRRHPVVAFSTRRRYVGGVIPEETIAEIKRRADIGAIIGRTVKLKKQGKNLLGLCPFHTEKSPSFNVRPDEGFFYCFGCRAAGDVVEFLVKTSGRGFLDVLTELAAETGVAIPQTNVSAEESEAQRTRKRLKKICEHAQLYFRTRLHHDEGAVARAYLKDHRKIDDATIDSFGLGYGGSSDKGLRDFLVSQGHSSEDAIKAGVLGLGERGEYDFFRQRVTIPIRDTRGDIVSFGGRIFGAAAEPWRSKDGSLRTPPKYLNGQSTGIYDKSFVLYGLFEAQPALKQGKPAVLVEGYFDAIAVHRAGLATAVAPCGTSLTPGHIAELKKRVGEGGRVVVCLDADKAGQEAAAKAILMLLQADLDAALVVLPEKDPDELVQAGRLDELRGMLLSAKGALEHMIDRAREKASGSIQARVAAIDGLLPFLAAPARDLVRKEAVRAASMAFGEDEGVIAKEVADKGRRLLHARLRGESLQQQRRAPSTTPTGASPAREPRAEAHTAKTIARAKPKGPPLNDLEVQLAKIVLCHPELAPRVALLLPHLDNLEFKGFITRLVDALVRFIDLPPREALTKVGMKRSGQLVVLADRIHLDEPDRVIGLSTALSIVDDVTKDLVTRQALEARLGALQPILAAADSSEDHDERKRLLHEQKAIVLALQALDAPKRAEPLKAAVERVTQALEAAPTPLSLPPAANDDAHPPADDPPWGDDDDDW